MVAKVRHRVKYALKLRYDTGLLQIRQDSFDPAQLTRMSFLIDFFPLIAFYTAYKLKGIFVATAVLMVAAVLQIAVHYLHTKTIKKMYVATAGLALVFGGITIALQDPRFVQWKFTIVYWLFAFTFFTSFWWGKRPLIQSMLETVIEESGSGKLDIAPPLWRNLNLIWVAFFTVLGFINIYVFQNFSMDTWTDFKVIWSTVAFFAFIVANMFWLFRYLPDEEES